MTRRFKAPLILTLFFFTLFSTIFQIVGCTGDAGPLEDYSDQLPVEFLISGNFHYPKGNNEEIIYLFPAEDFIMTAQIMKSFPREKLLCFVFTIVQNTGGDYLKQIVNTDISKDGWTEVKGWFLRNEGTYTVRCDLYNNEDYENLGEAAPRLATAEKHLVIQPLNLRVAAEAFDEARYRFTPEIINTELLPSYYYYYAFRFGDDTGSVQYSQNDDITHHYQQEGSYTVEIELIAQSASFGKAENGVSKRKYETIAKATVSISVNKSIFSILTPSSPLTTGQYYAFKAVTSGILPDTPFYEWDFGDNQGIKIPFSNEATHSYEKEGSYTVLVKVYKSDSNDAPLLGQAAVQLKIEPGDENILSYLQQTTYLEVIVSGATTEHKSDGTSYPYEGLPLIIYSNEPSTIWTGNHFSHIYSRPPSSQTGSGVEVTIEGDVSQDGNTITSLSARIIYDDSQIKPGQSREQRIALVNVPIKPKFPVPATNDPNYKSQFTGYIEGSEVKNCVTETFFEYIQPKSSDPDFKLWYDPFRFENTLRIPYLLVVFKTSRIDAYDDPGYQKRN